jgi:Flp pilus assembly pilin Flp
LTRTGLAGARDDHGQVVVEYTILLALVAAGAVAALVALGPRLLDVYRYQQALLTLPVP